MYVYMYVCDMYIKNPDSNYMCVVALCRKNKAVTTLEVNLVVQPDFGIEMVMCNIRI